MIASNFYQLTLENITHNLITFIKICADYKCLITYIRTEENVSIFLGPNSQKFIKFEYNSKFKDKFATALQFYSSDLNKIMLLFRKGVYSYEYMNNCQNSEETPLPSR